MNTYNNDEGDNYNNNMNITSNNDNHSNNNNNVAVVNSFGLSSSSLEEREKDDNDITSMIYQHPYYRPILPLSMRLLRTIGSHHCRSCSCNTTTITSTTGTSSTGSSNHHYHQQQQQQQQQRQDVNAKSININENNNNNINDNDTTTSIKNNINNNNNYIDERTRMKQQQQQQQQYMQQFNDVNPFCTMIDTTTNRNASNDTDNQRTQINKDSNNNINNINNNPTFISYIQESSSPSIPSHPKSVSRLLYQQNQLQHQYNIEQIIIDYQSICTFYNCSIDFGVIVTIRYNLSTLYITTINFHDIHLISICDLLLLYGNGPLQFITSFNFSRPKKRNIIQYPLLLNTTNHHHNTTTTTNNNIIFHHHHRSKVPFNIVPTYTGGIPNQNNNAITSTATNNRSTGFGTYGAIALSKWISVSLYMKELYIDRNPIGPYGSSYILIACSTNSILSKLSIRRCHVGEYGAIIFTNFIIQQKQIQLQQILLQSQQQQSQSLQSTTETNKVESSSSGNTPINNSTTTKTTTNNNTTTKTKYCNLQMVDLSANRIGYYGSRTIEIAMMEYHQQYTTVQHELLLLQQQQSKNNNINNNKQQTIIKMDPLLVLDMEGNLVLQEVMNSVTHGLGIILALIGSIIVIHRVQYFSLRHQYSCIIYSISLIVLYTSSTLYHSFFTLRHTKWLFEVIDKCAIYILIAGSYTPFLQIVLAHKQLWSQGLLCFLWMLCILGVSVEFLYPTWKHKGTFSLIMFLSMGWSALICLPEVARIIPHRAIHLMTMGGVAYTAGVPFFVRNNNLDHAIWHLFVLAGSIFHWCGVYFYVIPTPEK